MAIKFLDCTLRDGGYYNDWDFDTDLVSEYLKAVACSGVDYVELGLRRFHSSKCLGAHAFTTDHYIKRLNLPKGPKYGVMVDAKTIIDSSMSSQKAVTTLFGHSRNESISLVRVAAHFDELGQVKDMLTSLSELGYEVGLNIMQASQKSSDDLAQAAKMINQWELVDVLYFADSLGSMNELSVERIYKALRNYWLGDMGFHAHNNMGQGCANVKKAIDLGCTWVDGTVSGMGRGAGNAETEYLLVGGELGKEMSDHSKIVFLANKYFYPMKRKFGWGASIEYLMGAKLGLHPTYIQELCADQSITMDSRFSIIEDLGKLELPSKFSSKNLQAAKSALSATVTSARGEVIDSFLKGREVLLIAQTGTVKKYKTSIMDYIEVKKPFVISINLPPQESTIPYDLVAVTHNEKYRVDLLAYSSENYYYVAPSDLFTSMGSEFLERIRYNYGLEMQSQEFSIREDYCVIPFPMTVAYAVAFVIQAGANSIKLIGFDGHTEGDFRHKNMENFFQIMNKENINLASLTPTKYALAEKSLHDLL